MCFRILRHLVLFACVVSFASPRAHELQRRSFTASALPTSMTESAFIRKEPSLSPSKTPAFPNADRVGPPLNQDCLLKRTQNGLLDQGLMKEYEARVAPIRCEGSPPRDCRRELCNSFDKEHSTTPREKPRLPEVSSTEGSSGSAKAHARDRDETTAEAHMHVQPSTPRVSLSTLAGIPIKQEEIIMATNQGRGSPKRTQLPGEKELAVNQALYPAFQHLQNLLQDQVGYGVGHDRPQDFFSKSKRQQLPSQNLVKKHEVDSTPCQASAPKNPKRDCIFCYDKEHLEAPSKKPRLREVPTAQGDSGSVTNALDKVTLGAQMYFEHISPQGSSTTLALMPVQKEMVVGSNNERSPSKTERNPHVVKPSVELSLSLDSQHPKNSLASRIGSAADNDRWLRLGRYEGLHIPINQVSSRSEMSRDTWRLERYPSRILSWEPRQINPKMAHGAEILAKDLSTRLPSVFSLPITKTQSRKLCALGTEPPNMVLLPLTYELIMKGITGKHWTTVKQVSEDFWNHWSNSNALATEIPIPLFIWFCEFILEATVPQLFAKVSFEKKHVKKLEAHWASSRVYPHIALGVSKLIRYLSIGDHEKYKLSTRLRIRSVTEVYELGTRECSEVIVLERFQNIQQVHRNLFEKLKSTSEHIRKISSFFWHAYQRLSRTAAYQWLITIRQQASQLASSKEVKWENLFTRCHPEVQEKLIKILRTNTPTETFPISFRLRHIPCNPDDLLANFIVHEIQRSAKEEEGFDRFLSGRIHSFFEENVKIN